MLGSGGVGGATGWGCLGGAATAWVAFAVLPRGLPRGGALCRGCRGVAHTSRADTGLLCPSAAAALRQTRIKNKRPGTDPITIRIRSRGVASPTLPERLPPKTRMTIAIHRGGSASIDSIRRNAVSFLGERAYLHGRQAMTDLGDPPAPAASETSTYVCSDAAKRLRTRRAAVMGTFVNPPYSDLKTTKKNGLGWVEKAHNEALLGKTIVLLIPSRTDTQWFHDIILKNNYKVRFLKGRLKFLDNDGKEQNPASFSSMLVIMK